MKTEIFQLERFVTPLGRLLLVQDDQDRLRAVDWEDYEPRMQRLLRRYYRNAEPTLRAVSAPSRARRALEAYFEGELGAISDFPTETAGTRFQRQVWAALTRIPCGQTLSYGALAAAIGRPAAVRAVGLANGANPIAIVVPCHRVIGANATLTGYAGGLERKRWLLAHEANTAALITRHAGAPRVA